MSARLKIALPVVLAFSLVLVLWFVVRPRMRARLHAVDALPANAFLVLTVDVDALRNSPLGAPLFGGAQSRLLGEKAITDLCGFDPLARVSEIAVAVPEESAPGDFGVVVRASISKGELLECAEKVILSRKEGGQGHPVIRAAGSYTLIEAETSKDPAEGDSARRYPTLAYRDGGPFLIGRGPWLDTMIDTVDGRLPNLSSNLAHMSMRKDLGKADGKDRALAVLGTVLLPKDLRERLKGELGEEAGGDAARNQTMEGVLGVSVAGAGVSAGAAGGDAEVVLMARCEDAGACAAVEKLVAKKRFEWSQDLSLRLFGLGPLLDSVKIDNLGATLRITAHAPSNDAARWLETILKGRTVHHPMPAGPLTSAPRTGPSSFPGAAGGSAVETLKPIRGPLRDASPPTAASKMSAAPP